MDDLKRYYYSRCYIEGMPMFDDLDPDVLIMLKGSHGFQIWLRARELEECLQHIQSEVDRHFNLN